MSHISLSLSRTMIIGKGKDDVNQSEIEAPRGCLVEEVLRRDKESCTQYNVCDIQHPVHVY